MKKALFAFALLASFSSLANASEMKRACIDSKGGTYVASSNDSLACANGHCTLSKEANLGSLYEEGTLSQLAKAKDPKSLNIATELAISIKPALGESKNSNPSNEPKLYFGSNLAVFCTSEISTDEFEEFHIGENLGELR